MKRIGIFLACVLAAHWAKADEEGTITLSRYEIVTVSHDASLKRTQAVFDFQFVTRDNKTVTGPIRYSYNGVEKTPVAGKNGKTSLTVKPGKYRFQFFYNEQHTEVYTDSIKAGPQKRTLIKVYFDRSDINVIADKPVIYLYPEKTTEVNVQLKLDGEFLFTYPVYENGWTVTAEADGTLHQGNKTFKYLFWEGRSLMASARQTDEGFVTTTAGLTTFFEEKLSYMGLSSVEIQDFITYWVPRMQRHEKHLIRFVLNQDFNQTAALTVTPRPDRMIRVFMLWSPLEQDQQVTVKEQTLPAMERKGFTLVEWGGTEIRYNAPVTKNQ